ncbi:MAG: VWA domain-containing protein [Planctomycetes bacterium]|nr:VWA domain-containing protein [Planctomycetota bacterium]
MARRFARTRPLRQAGFLYRRLSQSPPLFIAIVIHGAIIALLMSIKLESDLPEVILTVDVSKVLAQKVERPPKDLIKPPEMAQNVTVDNTVVNFSAPTDALSDTNVIGDSNLIAGEGPGLVAPLKPGGPRGSGINFGERVRSYRRAGLDVVFVVDTTWTLKDAIDAFKKQINNIIIVLDKLVGARCRIGVVCYRDKAGAIKIKTTQPVKEFYHTKTLKLTKDRGKLREFVQSMGVGPGPKTEQEAKDFAAGKGIPANEDVYEGLRLAAEMPWSDTARRVIILMGDAPPHNEDMAKVNSLIGRFRAGGNAALHVIYSKPPFNTSGLYGAAKRKAKEEQEKQAERVYAIFRDFARRGGGEAESLANAKQVVTELLVFAFGRPYRKNVDEVYHELGVFADQKKAPDDKDKKEGAGGVK